MDLYNNQVISTHSVLTAEDQITGYDGNTQFVTAKTKLHKMSTAEVGGLPYLLNVACETPYMVTLNIDVADGIVNGAIGTLKYIERHIASRTDSDADRTSNDLSSLSQLTLWIEFPEERTGKVARVKCRPHVVSAFHEFGSAALKWTPISVRTVSGSLGGSIRFKRRQFPLVPAAAITIHKAQGATFDQVVFEYDKSQQTSLVYVAMSRVTSVEGLYITNAKNDFIFYHGRGSIAPIIKDLRDEFARLQQHQLPTLTKQVRRFINPPITETGIKSTSLLIINLNVQSLVAHASDIESDVHLRVVDYLALSETWMDPTTPIHLSGFELVCQAHESCTGGPSPDQQPSRRTAGGVAIYRNLQSCADSQSLVLQMAPIPQIRRHQSRIGETCQAEVSLSGSP